MAGASTEYNSLLKLKGELSQALGEHGPNHPNVKTLQTQIQKIEEFVKERQPLLSVDEDELQLTPDDVMGAYVRLLENDLLALKKRRDDLTKQIAEAEEKAKALVDYELEDEQRIRELQRTEELYDSIVGRLRDINMQQGTNALIQEIIESPESGTQVSPKPLIAAVICMLATMLLAGSAVIASELADKRIHSARELEDIYQARIVSHIPDLQQDAETRASIKKIGSAKPQVSPFVLAFHEPKSKISEAIRTVRTQLFLDLERDDKLIAVTSPSQGDGKSTISANLAASIAQTGKSVLLLDADMRRPAVHTLFGLSNDVGLSTVLTEESEFHDVVQRAPSKSLSVLTAGPIAESPAELLCSAKFQELLEMLREKFDFIILDCPPVLPVTDPTIIAPLSDYVLLVTTNLAEKGLPKAKQCHRSLDGCGISLGAIIVNRTQATNADYAYGDYQTDYSEYERYQEEVNS
jgi:capsular exopolysaccharide synthesis family protein